MAFTTLNLGLNLTIPTNGTFNWGTTVLNTTWTNLSKHSHLGSGDGNQIPTGGLADNSVTTAKLSKNYGWTEAATKTPAGTTETLDFDLGNIQFLDLGSASGDVTLTFNNVAVGSYYTIWVTQGATPRDLIWPVTAKWPQGQKPILSTVNGSVDKVTLYSVTGAQRGDWDLDYK